MKSRDVIFFSLSAILPCGSRTWSGRKGGRDRWRKGEKEGWSQKKKKKKRIKGATRGNLALDGGKKKIEGWRRETFRAVVPV